MGCKENQNEINKRLVLFKICLCIRVEFYRPLNILAENEMVKYLYYTSEQVFYAYLHLL